MSRLIQKQTQKRGDKNAPCDPASSRPVTYRELEENARPETSRQISKGFGKDGNPFTGRKDRTDRGSDRRAKPGEVAAQAYYPLTQTQYGILAESLAHPDSTLYNVPFLYRLSGRVNIARLKSAIEAAVSAHPYLSATLSADDHGGYRFRRDDAAPAVEIIEAKKLPEDLVKPFDLTGEKLCRLRIYKTDDGSYLFMDFYHIIYDDISGAILMQDIKAAQDRTV